MGRATDKLHLNTKSQNELDRAEVYTRKRGPTNVRQVEVADKNMFFIESEGA